MGTFEELGLKYSDVISIVGLFLAGAAIAVVLRIVFYVLRAAGICDMSRALKIKNPWYSFVPVAGAFAFGRLAVRGKKSVLPVFFASVEVLFIGSAAAVAVTAVFGWIDLIFAADKALAAGESLSVSDFSVIAKIIIPAFVLCFAAVVRKVFNIVCIFKVLRIFSPERAVLYTVISAIFSFMLPIFLFSVKNSPPSDEKNTTDDNIAGFNFG